MAASEKEDEVRLLTMEEALHIVGEYGRFQKFIDLVITLITFAVTYQILIMSFATITPTWRCVDLNNTGNTSSHSNAANYSNSTTCRFAGVQSADNKDRCHIDSTLWEYTEAKEFSLVTQFEIHCDQEWILNLLSSIFFVGWGVGAVVLGWIGDNYGRKFLLYPSFTGILVGGFICPFLPNIHLVVVCRFLIGFLIHGTFVQGYIMVSEIVGSKQRAFACQIILLSCPLSWIFLSLQAYLAKNWKTLSMICTAPYAILILTYKLVPESIEWLQAHRKDADVMHVISQIALWNKKELPNSVVICRSEENTVIAVCKSSPIDIFRTRKLAFQTLVLGYIWTDIDLSFYGLYMAADALGGSLYLNTILLSIVDIPALFTSIAVINRFGRKKGTLVPLLLGSVTCIATAFIPTEGKMQIARIVVAIIGKFFLSMAFYSIYTWSVEMYPTHVRSAGMGFMAVAARVGSASSPWIAHGLKPFGSWCPFLVMGAPSLAGFLAGLSLPETQGVVSNGNNNDVSSTIISNSYTCNNERELRRK